MRSLKRFYDTVDFAFISYEAMKGHTAYIEIVSVEEGVEETDNKNWAMSIIHELEPLIDFEGLPVMEKHDERKL